MAKFDPADGMYRRVLGLGLPRAPRRCAKKTRKGENTECRAEKKNGRVGKGEVAVTPTHGGRGWWGMS